MKKRFLEHLEAMGKIPKGYACGGMAKKGYNMGGMVEDNDDDDMEWRDGAWNDHEDTSGAPKEFTEDEVRHYMAKSLMKKKRGM